MPPKGSAIRAQQIATLSGLAHDLMTAPSLVKLVQELQTATDQMSPAENRNVELVGRDLEKALRLDHDFVVRRSKATSAAYQAWLQAREANDYSVFAPAFRDIVEIKKEEAERLTYADHPYDALLDTFEPEYTSAQLDRLFKDVKAQLVDFVRAIRQRPQVEDDFLYQHFPQQQQWDFSLYVLQKMGYDFDAGRQDYSPHPFTINFAPTDVRITTIADEHNVASMLWSCIHEGGHALYEQGLQEQNYGLPLGRAVSLGIHESQSRLWENNAGRSKVFWQSLYPELQARFPGQLGGIPLDQFFRGINKITPRLIRIESDELHYHFHILIRYEIEKGLLENAIDVDDIPKIWAEKYREYLDLEVPDDRSGALQDIHWAYGSLGYFPTYSLGSFYAAQFFGQAQHDISDLTDQLGAGNFAPLLEWLRDSIHQHGRLYTAEELCIQITGEPLNFAYFMEYAQEKYRQVYGR